MPLKHLEESWTLNADALEYIHRAAERGLYEIRGLGAKRKLPTFDDLVFLTASLSRYPLEGYRERCVDQDDSWNALRQEADRARNPDNHRRHELRRAVGARQGGDRPRRHGGRHFDYHRRRRHDVRRARRFEDPGLPVFAFALWIQS